MANDKQERRQKLTYTVRVEITADAGECFDLADDIDVMDAIAGAVCELDSYENVSCVSTKILDTKESWAHD